MDWWDNYEGMSDEERRWNEAHSERVAKVLDFEKAHNEHLRLNDNGVDINELMQQLAEYKKTHKDDFDMSNAWGDF